MISFNHFIILHLIAGQKSDGFKTNEALLGVHNNHNVIQTIFEIEFDLFRND